MADQVLFTLSLTNCMVANLIVLGLELAQTSALKLVILCLGLSLQSTDW